MQSIVVHDGGTKLCYLDSGPPPDSGPTYSTIFAVHGMMFSSPIFQKVSMMSRDAGIRFVAINRRGYKGSTPFTGADKLIFVEGTDTQKKEWLKNRGLEISNFINTFIVQENLSAISAEGKGGIALLGWSMGCFFSAAAIAHVGDLPSQVQVRFAAHLRAHIMLEPPPIALGMPTNPSHLLEFAPTMPAEASGRFAAVWITSYFQHRGLATRDESGLDVVPSTIAVPSLWNMSSTEAADIINPGPVFEFDFPLLGNFQPQAHEGYIAATFDKAVRNKLPHMKPWLLVGDATTANCISALWSIQDDDEAHGSGNVNCKVLHDANHFMHWDRPALTVDVFLEILS